MIDILKTFSQTVSDYLIHLFENILVDHLQVVGLIVFAAILMYLLRKIFFKILRFIEKPIHFTTNLIKKDQMKKLHKVMKHHDENQKKKINIKDDISKNIAHLNEAADDKKYAAIQFLLLHPSKDGFNAIFHLAVNEKNQKIREYLICSICQSAKGKKWYT